MDDINERKRDDNDTDKTVGNRVGVVAGDTMASALDPFGSVAMSVLAERWTTRRGKVPLNATTMAQNKRLE